MEMKDLNPVAVWHFFNEICQIPRPSKHEEKIAAYLMKFAEARGLEAAQDAAGNVLIRKNATKGKEKVAGVVLQAHMDMVCEKNADSNHDFSKDPIETYIDEGWLKAKGTTLGADNGIGMACALAVLDSKEISHGPIEALFTVDEETGLTGAFSIQPGFFSGRILLNLDSEDEGEIFVGCAGGVDTVVRVPYMAVPRKAGEGALRIEVKGLQGGHSGDDINRGRANAIKLLVRFLWEEKREHTLKVVTLEGGNLRNAIAREASAVIMVPSEEKETIIADFNRYAERAKKRWNYTEPGLAMMIGGAILPNETLNLESTNRILNAIYATPHGVITMSQKMPGMVETSTNLASVRMDAEKSEVVICTSQRSDLEDGKWGIAQQVESIYLLAGAEVVHSDGYPGWAPNPDSKILHLAVDAYKKLYGKTPVVRSIHAGLECGLFLEKYPDMDMISFGPTMRGVHSPDERIEIATVELWWKHLVEILAQIM